MRAIALALATALLGPPLVGPPLIGTAQSGTCSQPMPLEKALSERLLLQARALSRTAEGLRAFEVLVSYNGAVREPVEVREPDPAGAPAGVTPRRRTYETGRVYGLSLRMRKDGTFVEPACDTPERWIDALDAGS